MSPLVGFVSNVRWHLDRVVYCTGLQNLGSCIAEFLDTYFPLVGDNWWVFLLLLISEISLPPFGVAGLHTIGGVSHLFLQMFMVCRPIWRSNWDAPFFLLRFISFLLDRMKIKWIIWIWIIFSFINSLFFILPLLLLYVLLFLCLIRLSFTD